MASKQDGFGHEKPFEGETNDWITPEWIIDAFNTKATFPKKMFFDLDPCISMTQPWQTAVTGYNVSQNGLALPWYGLVYCNPPYGNNVGTWAERMADHGSGIMLIFARLETSTWQDIIFPTADGFLFPKRRIAFARPDGTTPKSSAGAPSAFIGWGEISASILSELCDEGKLEGSFFGKAVCTGKSYRGKRAQMVMEI